MVKLAATLCLQQRAETANCSEELLLNADGFFPIQKERLQWFLHLQRVS